MNTEVVTMNRGRSMLNKQRNVAKNKQGLRASDVRPHELLLYAKLEANNNNLTFNINKRNNNNHVMEILLDENDMFTAYGMALGVHKILIDANGVEQPAHTAPVYYGDPILFPTAAPAGAFATEAQAIEMIYNALLRVESEQDIRLKEYNTQRFRTVPQTPVAANGVYQYDGSQVKDLYTGLTFWGGNRDDLEIKLRNGDYAAIAGNPAASGHQNYAVIRLVGNITVGGAKKFTAGRARQVLNR